MLVGQLCKLDANIYVFIPSKHPRSGTSVMYERGHFLIFIGFITISMIHWRIFLNSIGQLCITTAIPDNWSIIGEPQ